MNGGMRSSLGSKQENSHDGGLQSLSPLLVFIVICGDRFFHHTFCSIIIWLVTYLLGYESWVSFMCHLYAWQAVTITKCADWVRGDNKDFTLIINKWL